ncbi:4380_t:CDS:2 [Cetraspora pellucida]|uniref:4380_t:CDS:1 n=1 Tax=Cetraspora pellucida TaxID=1433469 RepID=A0ACA9KJ92_9GLOM|nr:4380_t:CDS:2 [Cetraspora pellucida]
MKSKQDEKIKKLFTKNKRRKEKEYKNINQARVKKENTEGSQTSEKDKANNYLTIWDLLATMGVVEDILFLDNCGPTSLPTAVLVAFDKYNGPTLNTPKGICVVPIVPIQCTWDAIIDLGQNEFAAGLSFMAVSRVHSLRDIIFKPFTFERLQRIKKCKRLRERILKEEQLISVTFARNNTHGRYSKFPPLKIDI